MISTKMIKNKINKRLIVSINHNICTGCGSCVSACLTGALKLINGKATLVNEKLCDGFGSCIIACPYDAITLEYREAAEFNWSILNKISFKDLMEKLRMTSYKTT